MYFNEANTIPALMANYLTTLPQVLKQDDPQLTFQLNADFERTLHHLAATTTNRNGYPWTPDDIAGLHRMATVIQKLMPIYDLTLELIGSWLWIQGRTYPHRTLLKRLGCNYSATKAAWFFRPYAYQAKDQRTPALDAEREQFAA